MSTRHSISAIFAILFISTGLLGTQAQAKDLTNRLGIGYRDQFATAGSLPGIAAQYYPTSDIGLAAVLGVDTQPSQSKFGFMVRANRIIFMEDNMNFYMGAAAGLISDQQPGASNNSGFQIDGFAGAEFFLTGLDSLGFSFETGAGISSLSNGVRFRTFGDFPTRAGVTFYF
jgi:hypothetical protein